MKPVRYLGKVRGYVKGNTYYSERDHRHFFVKYQGFGISSKIVNHLRGMGVFEANILYHLKDSDKTRRYIAPLETFEKRGRRYTDVTDSGIDLQYILPINEMEMIA